MFISDDDAETRTFPGEILIEAGAGAIIIIVIVARAGIVPNSEFGIVLRVRMAGIPWVGLVSGMINASFLVGDVQGLRATSYGRLLTLKLLLFAGMVCLAAVAWAGHAAAVSGTEGAIHLVADIGHLVAAAAWVGALIPLALLLHAARREESGAAVAVARAAVERFSSLGIASVGTLVVTGSVNTRALVGRVSALVDTDYGRLLLAKVALFLVMLSFGAINRLWLTPRLAHAPKAAALPPAVRQIERNSLIEAGLAAAVIAIVALLGTLPAGLQD